MRDELNTIWQAISKAELPADSDTLFGPSWNCEEKKFQIQETYLIDFKDRVPGKFTDDFGASILRLALAFHNSYGGIIVFGVVDRTGEVIGSEPIDIEAFNRILTEVSGLKIECLSRTYEMPGADGKAVSVLLVPRRGFARPVRLSAAIGPYRRGILWVRERHEVLEANATHIPILYSSRDRLPSDAAEQAPLPIHRSLPPTPATMHDFIGRQELMANIWDWFVFSTQPRLYLHGPGGSGKSTLAYEFARLLADTGFSVVLPEGERVDYVIFLSAKETELNPLTGRQEIFSMRQFSDASSEFAEILYHSGHVEAERIEAADEAALLEMLRDLFGSYTGLIVLDDIDALSRRGADTGEESLFIEALKSSRRTRILYTLRFPPSHARNSALQVPGLSDPEFYSFLESCCEQFDVLPPPAEIIPTIQEITNSLPLLVETVVGLRRFTGSFREAVDQFRDRGGDDARRYLYQREYDQLSNDGKSREVMAALSHLREAVSYPTLANLLGLAPETVTAALSECASIFLSTVEGTQGETLYQLTAPSRPFVAAVSARLDRSDFIERKVEHFRRQGIRYSAAEASLIVRMNRLIRAGQYTEIISLGEALHPGDPTLANPRIRALMGQAYANQGPASWEKARECFRLAQSMNFRDLHMMRSWYYLETRTGYGLDEAKRICRTMLESDGVAPRVKSEFWSKLAWCYLHESFPMMSVSPEKAIALLGESITYYLEALWVIKNERDFDFTETREWLRRPLKALVKYIHGDLNEYLLIIERLPARKHDVSIIGAELLIDVLIKSNISYDASMNRRLAGLFQRAATKLDRYVKDSDDYPGLSFLIDSLQRFHAVLTAE